VHNSVLLSDDVVESEGSIQRFDEQIFVELLEELHPCEVALISNILKRFACLYVQENHR